MIPYLTAAAGGALTLFGVLVWRHGPPKYWPLRDEVYPADRLEEDPRRVEDREEARRWFTAQLDRHQERITAALNEAISTRLGIDPDDLPSADAMVSTGTASAAEPEWMTPPKPRGRKRCACRDVVSSGDWNEPKHVEHRRLGRLAMDAAEERTP